MSAAASGSRVGSMIPTLNIRCRHGFLLYLIVDIIAVGSVVAQYFWCSILLLIANDMVAHDCDGTRTPSLSLISPCNRFGRMRSPPPDQ